MQSRLSKTFFIFLIFGMTTTIYAQEQKVELSGTLNLSYSKSKVHAQTQNVTSSDNDVRNQSRDLGFGLDLHLGTYIIDPRFLKLSFDGGFTRNKGAFDEFDTRYGITGLGVNVDFLPTSPYPFRFHFNKQDSNYLEKQITNASSGRKSIGFDWQLRLAKYPRLFVNFDDTDYDTRFLTSSAFKSHARNFTTNVADKLKGWDVNSSYHRQSSDEGITDLRTNLHLLRFDARRPVAKKSNLYINSSFENLHFLENPTRPKQGFSFFNMQSDLLTAHTEKLSTRIYHQYYRNNSYASALTASATIAELSTDRQVVAANRDAAKSPNLSPMEAQRLERQKIETNFLEAERQRVIEEGRRLQQALQNRLDSQSTFSAANNFRDLTSAARLQPTENFTNSFHAIGTQATYRLRPEITVSGATGASFIQSPHPLNEFATRLLDVSGTVSWNKRVKFIDTRASVLEGLAYAKSNFNHDRNIEFHNYSAGVSVGDMKYILVSADYNYSFRPDTFQIGGFFADQYLNGKIETQPRGSLRLYATIGKNTVTYLTNRGREDFRKLTYSAGLDHRIFTLLYSRNHHLGLRDVFTSTLVVDPSRMFIVLPTDTLIRDPFLKTSGTFTLGLARVKPARDLDIEVRYLKDQAYFIVTNNVFGEQLDVIITYKLGKFTVMAGALIQQQDTQNLLMRDRTYYFFRVSRPFRIF
ncbi:MAG: hypothetical protein AB1757_17320 [Acidobacteriota bacterium]